MRSKTALLLLIAAVSLHTEGSGAGRIVFESDATLWVVEPEGGGARAARELDRHHRGPSIA